MSKVFWLCSCESHWFSSLFSSMSENNLSVCVSFRHNCNKRKIFSSTCQCRFFWLCHFWSCRAALKNRLWLTFYFSNVFDLQKKSSWLMWNDQKDKKTIVQRWRFWSKFFDESTMKWRRKWWIFESNRSYRKTICFFLNFSWCSFSFSTIRNMSRSHSRIFCFVWHCYTFD